MPFVHKHLSDFTFEKFIGDPAGNTGEASDNRISCFTTLKEFGIPIEPAKTNALKPRLEAVRYSLTRLVETQPQLVICRDGADVLRKGFLGGYHYRKLNVVGAEIYDDKPNKNEFSHNMDTLEYLLMYYNDPSAQAIRAFDIKKYANPALGF